MMTPYPDETNPLFWIVKYHDGIDTHWYVYRPGHGDIGFGLTREAALLSAVVNQRKAMRRVDTARVRARTVLFAIEDAVLTGEEHRARRRAR